MTKNKQHIGIIAGETSGDMRAASLIRELKILKPHVRISGIAGPSMLANGVEAIAHIDDLSVMGITEVLKNLGRIKKIFNQTLAHIQSTRPDAVVLVDYPGFNLRLAKAVKALGIKVIYYISPKVWAWKESRVKIIRKVVDRMIVIFPFEVEFYKKHGMNVDYVGNPIVDDINVSEPPSSLKATLKLAPNAQTIGLLPGSRQKEIERHMPIMVKTAQWLVHKNPKRQFIVIKAPLISKEKLEYYLKSSGLNYRIYGGSFYNGVCATDAVIASSGTATLEAGLLLKPMAVMYVLSTLTYEIARRLMKIRYASLVNIIAGREIVKEFIQHAATDVAMGTYLDDILNNPNRYAAITNDLAMMKSSLGKSGANKRAAAIVAQVLGKL